MDILITICARGGSKGIPGKNIRPLNGIPLLHYSLKCAKKFSEIYGCDIQLSTDSDEILACAAEFGYFTEYKRPLELAQDGSGKADVIREAWKYAENLNNTEYTYVLDLDVTSPLRTIEDLKSGLEMIKKDPSALNLFSVSPAARNPYFNIVEQGTDGYFKLVKNMREIKSRQMAPKVFDMNASFYFISRAYLEGDYSTATTEKSLVYVMPHICFDLDEFHDFDIMELMLTNKMLGFSI